MEGLELCAFGFNVYLLTGSSSRPGIAALCWSGPSAAARPAPAGCRLQKRHCRGERGNHQGHEKGLMFAPPYMFDYSVREVI